MNSSDKAFSWWNNITNYVQAVKNLNKHFSISRIGRLSRIFHTEEFDWKLTRKDGRDVILIDWGSEIEQRHLLKIESKGVFNRELLLYNYLDFDYKVESNEQSQFTFMQEEVSRHFDQPRYCEDQKESYWELENVKVRLQRCSDIQQSDSVKILIHPLLNKKRNIDCLKNE